MYNRSSCDGGAFEPKISFRSALETFEPPRAPLTPATSSGGLRKLRFDNRTADGGVQTKRVVRRPAGQRRSPIWDIIRLVRNL